MIPPYERSEIITYSNLLSESYTRLTGRELIQSEHLALALYYAPFVLVSHGTEADPIFRYANLKAQELWGLGWEDFVQMPSRLTAEPVVLPERQNLLDQVSLKGYIDNYQGVRITKAGQRFMIYNATVWNVIDQDNLRHGQAALIYDWEWLES